MEVRTLVGELRGLVDQLAGLDVAALADGELQALVEGVQRVQSRLAVAASPALVEWESRGVWQATRARTAGLALANRVGRCHHRVADELGRARKLVEMPHTSAAVLDGRLSVDHADLFCRYATEARWGLFVRDEATLVEACAGLTLFADARKLVRYWADHADLELDLERTRPAPSEVVMARSRATGELTLRGTLSPIDAEQVVNELDRLCREIKHEDAAAGVERSMAQRRAAALVRMAARSSAATGVTPRPLFQVIVGDETVARLCELASGVVVHPDDLEPYLGTALVESFLFDDEHRLVGVSRQRTFTGRLRRAIQVRDRRCQHESGCPVPATDLHSDIDHIVPAAAGGPTSAANGRVQCIAHNRHEHLHGPPHTGTGVDPAPARPPTSPAEIHIRWIHLQYHELRPAG